jgi:hypothetical protein
VTIWESYLSMCQTIAAITPSSRNRSRFREVRSCSHGTLPMAYVTSTRMAQPPPMSERPRAL